MKYRKLGKNGPEVSAIGFGCMGLSHGYGNDQSEEEKISVIRKAYEAGCNFFDTAEAYGPYCNEELLGQALAGIRNNCVVATKCGMKNRNGITVLDGSPQAIRESLEGSLRRLNTDYIDLYYLHRVDPNTPIEVSAQCMKELIKEGRIRGWGLSEVDSETIRRAHAVCPLTAVESEDNMLWRNVESDVLPCLKELGVALVPFSPLAKGFMTGTITPDTQFSDRDSRRRYSRFQPDVIQANTKILNLIKSFAERYQVTEAQISLAWLLSRYEYLVPIPGTTKQYRVIENLKAGDLDLTAEDLEQLTQLLNKTPVAGQRC